MATVYISIGTNRGDRKENLARAIARLASDISPRMISPAYETKPVGFAGQSDFYNVALSAQTSLSPVETLARLKEIEASMGREKGTVNGPRVIDLDLLYYDDLVLESPELSVPHPRRAGRAFVYAPLADIAPNFVDPITGKTVLETLAEIKDRDAQVARL